jgi:hypothetical protein
MAEDDPIVTELAEHILPFGRRVRLLDVDYQNGLHMMRMIWREGKRITQVETDPDSAAALGADLLNWARQHTPSSDN